MKIGIIGVGNLGKSLARLVNKNLLLKDKLLVSDKIFVETNNSTISQSDILFICVKPTDMVNVLNEINQIDQKSLHKHYSYKSRLIVSCVSGISLKTIEDYLICQYPIMRCMTNVPISLGKGSFTYICNEPINSYLEDKVNGLLKGPTIIKTDNEKLIDLSTILTGSMPAYISLLSQYFIEFGEKNGLTYEQSRDWYITTIESTMEMLKYHSTEEIIYKVTSPNGVTAKGIEVMKKHQIKKGIEMALESSYDSISNLSKNKV